MVYSGWNGKEPTGTAPLAFGFSFFFLDFIKTAINQKQRKAVRRDTVREPKQRFGVLSSYLLEDMQMLGAR